MKHKLNRYEFIDIMTEHDFSWLGAFFLYNRITKEEKEGIELEFNPYIIAETYNEYKNLDYTWTGDFKK